MRTLSIHRAQGHAHLPDGPEPVTIIIDAAFPDEGNAERIHMTDAYTLARALHETLPGGIWDRLVADMLRRHASNLTIPRRQDDPAAIVGIAYDNRTGHHWQHQKGAQRPNCKTCGLWMTDWSLINDCGTTLDPASSR